MELKKCNQCNTEKEVSQFTKNGQTKDGLSYICKGCSSINHKKRMAMDGERILAQKRKYREDNKIKVAEQKRQCYIKRRDYYKNQASEYRSVNREKINLNNRVYYQNNKALVRASNNNWFVNNPGKRTEYSANRKASVKRAKPEWLTTEHRREISTIYESSKRLTESDEHEGDYHVDHIVPLNSAMVCGLHVPWNLRVISAKENMSKSNILMEQEELDKLQRD